MLTLRKILFIFLWILLSIREIKAAEPEQIVRVFGCSANETILEIRERVNFYLNYLQIDRDIIVLVTLADFSPQNDALDKNFLGTTIPEVFEGKPMMHIFIEKKISLKQQMLILAHEMIHVKQFVFEELEVHSERRIVWKGTIYWDVSDTDYLDRA